MSVPFGLTVSYDAATKTFTDVDLSRGAVLDLYGYLEPLFEREWADNNSRDKDYAGHFIGAFMGGGMTFDYLPAAEYRQACAWVFEAAAKFESLREYRDGLVKALKSDPRYKAA